MVLSDNSPFYQSFAETFRQNLPANLHLQTLGQAEDFSGQNADLIVSVGVRAAARVAKYSAQPLLAAMIPDTAYADLQHVRHGPISAIFVDQPIDRQVALLRAVLPDRQTIGVLYAATRDMSVLRAELNRHHVSLISRHLYSQDTLFSDLNELLANSDVLLAVPDSAIYNSNSIRNILLSSYRRGIPLIGFSAAYVKAGALCAIFSTPEQLAAQTASVTVSFAKTGSLPTAQYPALFRIAVNQEVARTLNIPVKTAEALRLLVEKSSGEAR